MTINILAIGDVVGQTGLTFLKEHLKPLQKLKGVSFTVVNGENANVVGITPAQADAILAAGADVVTLGNHTWTRWELQPYLDEKARILRPANYARSAPAGATRRIQRRSAPSASSIFWGGFLSIRTPIIRSRRWTRCSRKIRRAWCSLICTPRRRARSSPWAGFSMGASPPCGARIRMSRPRTRGFYRAARDTFPISA